MQAHAYTHARTYTLTHSHTRTCNGDRGKAHQELVGPQQTEEVVDERVLQLVIPFVGDAAVGVISTCQLLLLPV